MAYTNRPVSEPSALVQPVADYHDRVRWGPIIAGLFVALVSQLILSALGAAIGATNIANSGAPRTNAPDVAGAVGIWATISLLISLFIGNWVMARACGPMNRSTALLNAAILWATTLAFSAYLLASGVSGAFGVVANNAAQVANSTIPGGVANAPNVVPSTPPSVTAEQARQIAGSTATAGWSFVIGSLLGLVASLLGAALGARSPRATYNDRPVYSEPR